MSGGFLPPVVTELMMDLHEFEAGATKAQTRMGELAAGGSEAFDKLGKATVLGAAAIGVASVKMAADFETQMTRLYTAAGAPKDAVKAASGEVLKLGDAVGFSGTQMAEALYHPVSAGLDLKTSLEAVRYSAEEAQISGASLDDTTYALSSVMKAFNFDASHAHDTMALLNSIVGQGDMRFQDFNVSVKNWAPTAAQMGISVQSMGAALAYLTDRGNSAEEASTRVTMGLTMMAYPSQKASKMLQGLGVDTADVTASTEAFTSVMRKTGITQNQLAEDLAKPDGIYVALTHLKTALQQAGVSGTEADSILSKIFGGGRSDKAILSLMQNLDGLKTKFDDIGKGAGAFDQAWADTQETFGFKMKKLGADAENLGIQIGSKLIPVIEDVVGWFARHKAAAEALAVIIGTVLVGSTLRWIGTLTTNFLSAIDKAITRMVALGAAAKATAAETETVKGATAGWASTVGNMVPLVGGLAAGIVGLGTWLQHLADDDHTAATSTDTFSIALINSQKSAGAALSTLDEFSQKMQKLGAATSNLSDPLAQTGLGMVQFHEKFGLGTQDLQNFDGALAAMVQNGNGDRAAEVVGQIANATDKQGKALVNVTTAFPAYTSALKAKEAADVSAAGATDNSTSAAKDNSSALAGNKTAMKDATGAANDMADSINKVDDAFSQLSGKISASGMLHEFQKDLLSVKDTLDQNGKSFNDNTLDGLKNEEAFRNAANAIANYRDAQIKNGGVVDDANKKAADQAQSLIDVWGKLTDNKKAVDDYAKSIGLVPSQMRTDVSIPNIAEVQSELNDLAAQMYDLTNGAYHQFSVKHHAAGGLITGSGGPTSDDVPIMASAGEFMMRAAAVDRFGVPFMEAINAGVMPAAPATSAATAPSIGGYGSGGGYGATPTVPVINVYLDGQEFTGAVRVQTLRYDQRNSGNNLTLSGRGFQ